MGMQRNSYVEIGPNSTFFFPLLPVQYVRNFTQRFRAGENFSPCPEGANGKREDRR
jgi:hypothetical protein